MTTLPQFLPLLQDRPVLVLGLGASGLAMADWCARAGARVTVADNRAAPPQAPALAERCPQAEVLQSDFGPGLFQQRAWAMVCCSPGLAPQQTDGVVQAARAAGVPVVGELGLFAQALNVLAKPWTSESPHPPADTQPEPYKPVVLAITGTNGKTTVTSLTHQLLERAGWRVALAGNIGPNLLDVLSRHLAAHAQGEPLPQAWVLELSSFQLHGVQGFNPSAATVLNLSQDHLDWHGTFEAYAAAKGHIFGQKALMLLNRDDPHVMAWRPQPTTLREGSRVKTLPGRPYVTFGAEAPTRHGDWGLETVNGMCWLVRAQSVSGAAAEAEASNAGSTTSSTSSTSSSRRRGNAEDDEIFMQRLMPAEALRIRGRHNATNALAALALATAAGAPLAPMLHGLREYRGEPHRVEPIAIVNEVEFFDDSKGTNVGATLAAINGLGAERKVVVILGGEGKGQDFSPLAPAVARHCRAVVLIGKDGPAIGTAIVKALGQGSDQVPQYAASSLPEAVELAAAHARPGDAVLLSPACASFDMFRDYQHRAEVFVQAVAERQEAQGMPS